MLVEPGSPAQVYRDGMSLHPYCFYSCDVGEVWAVLDVFGEDEAVMSILLAE